MRRHAAAVIILGLGACATPGQVRRVETQLAVMERNQARADSARAAELTTIITLQRRLLDSLGLASRTIASIKGEMSAEFTESRRQMLQVQTLMGQSQQRLTDLRNQLEARSDVPTGVPPTTTPNTPADSARTAALGVPAGTPSAEVMYSQAQRQLAQGSMATARSAFRDLLKYYPTSPRVPDALYGIAESFAAVPDSQFLYYSDVERFPRSAVAPRALFKLAVLEEQRGNRTQARVYYQRVIDRYPDWEDIDLVRDRLRTRQ